MLLAILRACEEEGEDLPLSSILEGLRGLGDRYKDLLEGLKADYGDLPPRVALARMAKDPDWRGAVEEASRAYLEELLGG